MPSRKSGAAFGCLFLVVARSIYCTLASLSSYHEQLKDFDWTLDGNTPSANLAFGQCAEFPLNVTYVLGPPDSGDDLFVLTQTPSGPTVLQNMGPANGDIKFQLNSSLGSVVLSALDSEGVYGGTFVTQIQDAFGPVCSTTNSTNVITLSSNTSSDQIVDFCDVVGFQLSGGRKPYTAFVTSPEFTDKDRIFFMINATLGPDDDVFLLPNSFTQLQVASVIVSFVDQDGTWSNSSDLLSFKPQPSNGTTCGLNTTSGTSTDIALFPSQVPSAPLPPTTSPALSGSQKSKGVSPAAIAVPVVLVVSAAIMGAVFLWRRKKKQNEEKRFPAVIPDVWYQPDTDQHTTTSGEGFSPLSSEKTRNHSSRNTSGAIGRRETSTGQEEVEDSPLASPPSPRHVYHIDGGSVQEHPPPYQDRSFRTPRQDPAATQLRDSIPVHDQMHSNDISFAPAIRSQFPTPPTDSDTNPGDKNQHHTPSISGSGVRTPYVRSLSRKRTGKALT